METASLPARAVPAGAYGPEGRPDWLDVDWREHQRWVQIDGRRVNVIEIGEGPPVLFVHGHSGCWQNWLENLPRPPPRAGARSRSTCRASASPRCRRAC